MNRRPTKALQSVAYHEAGHAVVAWRFGVRTKRLSIIPDEAAGSAGRLQHEPYFTGINPEFDSSPRVQRRLENMAMVCFAGPAAQRRFNPRGWRNYHGEDDFHQAVNLLSYLASSNDQLQAYVNLIEICAHDVVSAQWHLIEDLASALLERGELTGRECRNLLREAMVSGPNGSLEKLQLQGPARREAP